MFEVNINKIFLEDCRETLKRNLAYDYAFITPPDFSELGMDPTKDNGISDYVSFLKEIITKINPRNNCMTFCFSDRKAGGRIIPKHIIIYEIMKTMDYQLISQKIWCKSYKQNLYNLNYGFIISFGKGKIKQNHNGEYEVDLFNYPVHGTKGHAHFLNPAIPKAFIGNFTSANQIVYNPFMGAGSVALACMDSSRYFLGSEIDKDIYNIGQDNIKIKTNQLIDNTILNLSVPLLKE